ASCSVSSPRLGRVAPLTFPGRPGRPRRADKPANAPPEIGAVSDSKPGPEVPPLPRTSPATLLPRLLDVGGTALYISVSPWVVRAVEAQGVLRRVRVPLPNGGELRKVLFDRLDLDRLIVAWKS